MASVVDPNAFLESRALGFENHLNVFHQGKQGLPEALAWGLTMFLSTTAIDLQFRRFNGHTQVNATDLKQLKFPNRKALMVLGEWAMTQNVITQTMIDQQLETITT